MASITEDQRAEALTCCVCLLTPWNATLGCSHNFCAGCLAEIVRHNAAAVAPRWFYDGDGGEGIPPACPKCRAPIASATPNAPSWSDVADANDEPLLRGRFPLPTATDPRNATVFDVMRVAQRCWAHAPIAPIAPIAPPGDAGQTNAGRPDFGQIRLPLPALLGAQHDLGALGALRVTLFPFARTMCIEIVRGKVFGCTLNAEFGRIYVTYDALVASDVRAVEEHARRLVGCATVRTERKENPLRIAAHMGADAHAFLNVHDDMSVERRFRLACVGVEVAAGEATCRWHIVQVA